MRQLANKLISNAVDAMGNGGALRITAEVTGANGTERVWLKFSDSGHGIDPANLKRVFEPFFTTKKDVGTGLGLWVVERIVADHDGELLVDSQTIGDTGTTFTVVLPGDSARGAANGYDGEHRFRSEYS